MKSKLTEILLKVATIVGDIILIIFFLWALGQTCYGQDDWWEQDQRRIEQQRIESDQRRIERRLDDLEQEADEREIREKQRQRQQRDKEIRKFMRGEIDIFGNPK